MASAQEGVNQIRRFLANSLSFEEFEDWSARFSWKIHQTGDLAAQSLAYQIRAILNAHAEDLTEVSVRKDLEAAIRPFVNTVQIYWKESGKVLPALAGTTMAIVRSFCIPPLGSSDDIRPLEGKTAIETSIIDRPLQIAAPAAQQ
jgi:hypothetical protein